MRCGAERIAEAFAAAHADGRAAALMPYMMAGYPDAGTSRAIALAYADAGADLVEVGIPFSDPLADGPVIHAAATAALAAGTTVAGALEVARTIAERVPVVAMCYVNPIIACGPARFVGLLSAAGVSGLIVPDLPLEEASDLRHHCAAAGVAFVPLVAPSTPDARLAAIGEAAAGFLYAVSVTGTTGERAGVGGELARLLARARARTAVPIAAGFGISTPAQAAAAAAAGADGVIVGSRLVRAAGESQDPAGAVRELVAGLAAALSGAALG
ncbi:MAG TPA: tryptophan synthase subunit alpha [Solirubrobacteraceae bacterium]|nr:tryptophan synthase subunit alpha [Solirubrobacteraceae bacterium]